MRSSHSNHDLKPVNFNPCPKMPCFSRSRVYTAHMRLFAIALAAVLVPTLVACAPANQQAAQQGTQPSQKPAQGRAVTSKVSLDVFPIKKGEFWVVNASSGDDSESKEYTLELDEGPEVETDSDGAPVLLASATAGDTFADLAFYPDDAFLFVKIPLEVKRDASKARSVFCFFDGLEAGKARSKGDSFFGTITELNQAKERSQFGDCTLSKKR
jgi:hypothetical protein